MQDLIERGQKQVSGAGETPLIQFNQQNNEVNLGETTSTLNRDSRERVKAAVMGLLSSLTQAPAQDSTATEDVVTVEEIIEEGSEETSDE